MDFKTFMDEKMKPLTEENEDIKALKENYSKALLLYDKVLRDIEGIFNPNYILADLEKGQNAIEARIEYNFAEKRQLEKEFNNAFLGKKAILKKMTENLKMSESLSKAKESLKEYAGFMDNKNISNVGLYANKVLGRVQDITKDIAKQVIKENFNEPAVQEEFKQAIIRGRNYLKFRGESPIYLAVNELTNSKHTAKLNEFLNQELKEIESDFEDSEIEN